MITLICGIEERKQRGKKQREKLKKKKKTLNYRELMVTRGEESGEARETGDGDDGGPLPRAPGLVRKC